MDGVAIAPVDSTSTRDSEKEMENQIRAIQSHRMTDKWLINEIYFEFAIETKRKKQNKKKK